MLIIKYLRAKRKKDFEHHVKNDDLNKFDCYKF